MVVRKRSDTFRAASAALFTTTLVTLWQSSVAFSGPVNSPAGFPFAQMNASADTLLAGDLKIRVEWNSHSAALLARDFAATRAEVFTGGIASRTQHAQNQPAALACSGSRGVLYLPDFSAAHPQGRFEALELPSGFFSPGNDRRSGTLQCAMLADGTYAVTHSSTGKIFVSRDKSQATLPDLGQITRLIALDEAFVIIGDNGRYVVVSPGSRLNETTRTSTQVSLPQASPFSRLLATTRLAGKGNRLVQVDGEATLLAEIEPTSDPKNPLRIGMSVRLPVSPCEEHEVCGVSVATDGTWVVSGSWGSYLGTGRKFVRLQIPNLAEGGIGGVAFGHQGAGGRFVYLGNSDGDAGQLPTLASDHSEPLLPHQGKSSQGSQGSQSDQGSQANEAKLSGHENFGKQYDSHAHSVAHRSPKRWAVWLKGRAPKGTRALLPYSVPLRGSQHAGATLQRTGDLIIHTGPLPSPIPTTWAAYEPEVPFEPLLQNPLLDPTKPALDSVTLAAPWWQEALRLREGLTLIQAQGLTPAAVTVGVIDSGADMIHPAIAPILAENSGETPLNGLDDDANGFVDDVNGYDFVDEDAVPQDEFWHGSHVAALVARAQTAPLTLGVAPSTLGVAPSTIGVAPNARVLVVRALDSAGKSNSLDLARAIAYAVDAGSDLLNCSWGGGPNTQALRDAFAYAHSKGVLVFSSAGNDSLDTDKHPAVPKNYPGVVSVGAFDPNGRLSKFSNFGKTSVAFLAPGSAIESAELSGGLVSKSGTSMASPIASGTASVLLGLLKTSASSLTSAKRAEKLLALMCEGSLPQGQGKESRCGHVDLLGALQRLIRAQP